MGSYPAAWSAVAIASWPAGDAWKEKIFTKEQPFLDEGATERWIKDKAEYRNYLVRRNKGLAVASYGLYIPSEHQIVVYVQENRNRTFETIKHEVSHAVVDTIVPYAPLWWNEGRAEQMEMLERDESGLYFERHQENSWVVAQARE